MTLPLEDGLRYPFRADRPTDLFAVGGVLGIAIALLVRLARAVYPSVLLYAVAVLAAVPAIGLLGYLLRIFEATVAGDDSPPAFAPAAGLLQAGNRLLFVSIVYVFLPLALVVVTVRGAIGADPLAGGAESTLFLVGSTVTFLLVLGLAYVYPAAVGTMAAGEGIRAALRVRTHLPLLAHGAYFTGWTFALVFAVAGLSLMLTALASTTIFGLLAVFLAFYAFVAAARVMARGYRTATDRSTGA